MNDDNLIRFDQMTQERHRELSRRGGIASGERRRELAYVREKAIQYNFIISAKSDAEREIKEFRAWKKMQKRRKKSRDE